MAIPEHQIPFKPLIASFLSSSQKASNLHTSLPSPDLSDSHEEENEVAPINVSISNPTKIVGHGNFIHLDNTSNTSALIGAVVTALRDTAMFDENGRARPISLNVHSGVTVAGSRNVVGRVGRPAAAPPSMVGRKRRASSVSPL